MDRNELASTKRRQKALSQLLRLVAAEQMDTSRRGLIEAAGPTPASMAARRTLRNK